MDEELRAADLEAELLRDGECKCLGGASSPCRGCVVEELRRTRAELLACREVLRRVEWGGTTDPYALGGAEGCPSCKRLKCSGEAVDGTHAPDCALKARIP